jgi:hypothetical protein
VASPAAVQVEGAPGWPRTPPSHAGVGPRSEPHAVAPLEAEPGARFVGGRGLEGEGFEDAADLGDLLGIRAGELTASPSGRCQRARAAAT